MSLLNCEPIRKVQMSKLKQTQPEIFFKRLEDFDSNIISENRVPDIPKDRKIFAPK